MCAWRSHVYSNFFVVHPKPVQGMCGRRRSARPFGRQRPSKVAKIVKKRCFCGFSAGRCGQTVWPTGLGHISLDSMGHWPSLLFCTIFFPLISWPGRPFKVAWVKIGQRPSKNAVYRPYFDGRPRPNRQADRPDRHIRKTGWQCRFWGCKKIDPP